MASQLYPCNDPETLRRLAAAADVYLQGQLTAAVAADQRALVFAGFLAAASATLGGAAVSGLTAAANDNYLSKVALLTASGLLAAMILAVIAARPVRWFFPGSHPVNWSVDFIAQKPEILSLQELLADYDDRISKNHATMKINGRWILASACTGIVSLLIGGIFFICRL